jgi:hypothetical protein
MDFPVFDDSADDVYQSPQSKTKIAFCGMALDDDVVSVGLGAELVDLHICLAVDCACLTTEPTPDPSQDPFSELQPRECIGNESTVDDQPPRLKRCFSSRKVGCRFAENISSTNAERLQGALSPCSV